MTIEHLADALDLPGVGRVGVILPIVHEDAHPSVREGVARRRLCLLTGECPCGARVTMPNRATRRAMRRDHERDSGAVWQVSVLHADDCPAGDPALDRLNQS